MIIDIYEFIEQCKEADMTPQEAARELARAQAEEEQEFYESYYDRPDVRDGMAQQDIIDMYRRER